jgi:hypothetical protein
MKCDSVCDSKNPAARPRIHLCSLLRRNSIESIESVSMGWTAPPKEVIHRPRLYLEKLPDASPPPAKRPRLQKQEPDFECSLTQ